MKRLFSAIITGVSLLVFGASFVGCAPEEIVIQDEITLGRCLTPTELSAKIIDGEFIEFSWTKSKGATDFVLELYTDSLMTSEKLVETFTIPAADIPYTADLEADMTYYARVQAVDNSEKGLNPSNWAVYDRPLQTYAIKSSLSPELVGRSESSITIKWTSDPEVDHIRITPALKDGDDFTRFEVSADVVKAAQVEVTGLKPSVNYTLAVHFKSAQRGTVSAWTRPSVSGATEVNSAPAIKQAIADGAAVIKVAYADTVYDIGNVTLAGPVAIYGDAKDDGTNPTIAGTFTTVEATTSVHLEALNMEGMASTYGHMLVIGLANSMTEVSVKNCKISNFGKGIYYDNYGASVEKIRWEGNYIENIAGSGGDVFDVRKESSLPSIIFKNSTMTIGGRTYFRIDANATVGSFKMENCTLNNLCFTNDGNNNGVFNIRATITEFIFRKNVVLNMNDENNRCCLVAKNSTSALPTMSKNFFYNCYDRFFIPQKDGSKLSGEEFDKAAAEGRAVILVDGSVELDSDPCVDSGRDKLNVTNAQVLDVEAGDPRWFAAYVEIPEDLTQAVTPTGKTWNLTDGQTFKKMADKDMVRDGIRFFVKNTPINFTEKGFEFSGAAAVGEDGIPTDGAIGIKVNEPGSIVISAAQATGHSILTVSLDGEVSAAVPAGAEYQKITFADINKESMIYIYGSHPATMTHLQWTDDTQMLDKVLATPVVSISKKVVNERADDTITLTWNPVDFAGSYNVTIDGKTKNVAETTYAFNTAGYSVEEPGADFAIQVTAVPAADDFTRVESKPAELSFHVNDVPEEAGAAGIAGTIIFDDYVGKNSEGTLAQEFVAGSIKLSITADTSQKMAVDANNALFGTADSQTKYTTRFKTGATSGEKSGLKLTVDAKGTLKFAVRTGSNSSIRSLKVLKSGVEILSCTLDENTQKHVVGEVTYYDYFTTEVEAGEYDLVYEDGSVNIYAIEYIPAPAGPAGIDGTIMFDDYIGKNSEGTLAQEFVAGSIKLSITADTSQKMAVDANNALFGTADSQTKYTTRFKTGATSGEKSGLKLTVDAKGTIKIAVRTGSNSSIRSLKVLKSGVEILACTLDESTQKHVVGEVTYYDYFTTEVEAGEYDLVYEDGSVNIYAIEYTAAK